MRLKIDLTQGKVAKNVYFTSDFHLFHKNVIKFDNRPFHDVNEMHEIIEERWNQLVKPEDTVIYLGDLSFARREDITYVDDMLKRLNGTIHYIMGNHDDDREIPKFSRFASVSDYLDLKIAYMQDGVRVETLFCCMHYPIYSWNKAHHGSYMVHGHCHGNLHHGEDASFYNNRRVIDVGCMLTDYTPISYQEIMDKLKHVVLKEFNDRTT